MRDAHHCVRTTRHREDACRQDKLLLEARAQLHRVSTQPRAPLQHSTNLRQRCNLRIRDSWWRFRNQRVLSRKLTARAHSPARGARFEQACARGICDMCLVQSLNAHRGVWTLFHQFNVRPVSVSAPLLRRCRGATHESSQLPNVPDDVFPHREPMAQ